MASLKWKWMAVAALSVLFCFCGVEVVAQQSLALPPDMVWFRGGHRGPSAAVSFSPDGTMLAAATGYNVDLWRLSDRTLVRTLRGHSGAVTSIAFSPDGCMLASGSEDKTVKIWQVSNGTLSHTLSGHSDAVVTSVAFSPDGSILASGSLDGMLNLWRTADGALVRGIGHYYGVYCVAFSPDGQMIASGSMEYGYGGPYGGEYREGKIYLYRVPDGARVRTLTTGFGRVSSIAFSPDGQMLASASNDDSAIYRPTVLWRVADGSEINEWTCDLAGSLAFSPDGQALASCEGDSIVLRKVADGSPTSTIAGGGRCVTFSPDGTMIASVPFNSDLGVRIWRVSDASLTTTLSNPGHSSPVSSITISPDGHTLVSASSDSVRLWSALDGAPIGVLAAVNSQTAAFSPDGQILATGNGYSIKLWSMSNNTMIKELTGHSSIVTSLAFSPDGQILASGNYDKTVRLWRVSDWTSVGTLVAYMPIACIAFSPDGQTLATGEGNSIRLWSVPDRAMIRRLAGHSGAVTSVAFSPDGESIVSGSEDSTVRLWRVWDGVLTETLWSHTGAVASVAFSPDEQTVASASEDGTIRIGFWRYANDVSITIADEGKIGFSSVQHERSGKCLAFGRTDGTVGKLLIPPIGYVVYPDKVGNGGPVTVTVAQSSCQPFVDGIAVRLVGAGIPDVAATSVRVVSENVIEATFDLTDALLGDRAVVIAYPTAQNTSSAFGAATAAQSSSPGLNAGMLGVTPSITPYVVASIIGRSQVRAGRTQTYHLSVLNTGNRDASPTAWLTAPSSVKSHPLDWKLMSPRWRTYEAFSGQERASQQASCLIPTIPYLLGTVEVDIPDDPALAHATFNLRVEANTEEAVRTELFLADCGTNNPSPVTQVGGLLECSIAGLKNLAGSYKKHLTVTGGSEGGHSINADGFDHLHGYKTDVRLEKGGIDDYIRSLGRNQGPTPSYSELYVVNGTRYGLEDGSQPHWDIRWTDQHYPTAGGHGGNMAQFEVEIITSDDPNDICGPPGSGDLRWMQTRVPFPYTIMFENKPTASAPAADVRVVDYLDLHAFDPTSVMPGSIEFDGKTVTPTLLNSPPVGLREFSADVDLRPENNLIVRVRCTLDMLSGELAWTFNSLDPDTGLPPDDATAGFLPPGAEGRVSFSVTPRDSLPTGYDAGNGAVIVFDANPPLATPVWHNTIDNAAPISSVQALPAESTSQSFTVRWSGEDDQNGSGLKDFDVYVSEDMGPFKLWQAGTTATSAEFSGVNGHSYAYYCTARDSALNEESKEPRAEAITTVVSSNAPPDAVDDSADVNANCSMDISVLANDSDSDGDTLSVTGVTQGAHGAVSINSDGTVRYAPAARFFGTDSFTYVVGDGNGGIDTANVAVSVKDVVAPLITVPADITVEMTAPTGVAIDLGVPGVTDDCDDSPTVTNDAPSAFPLGTTVVTWTAKDASGNTTTAMQRVTLVDATPPTILGISASPSVLRPPNHKMVPVVVTVRASDACDPNPVSKIVGVTCNEPANAHGDGNTTCDWKITGPLTLELRAERSGKGPDRIYTIWVECADASNNITKASVQVEVRKRPGPPHDKR